MSRSLPNSLSVTCIPIILIVLTTSDVIGEQANREQIGTAHGKPVYRDQIAAEKGLTAELSRVFSIEDIANQYRQEHRAEITPTEDEIEAARAFLMRSMHNALKTRRQGYAVASLRLSVNVKPLLWRKKMRRDSSLSK